MRVISSPIPPPRVTCKCGAVLEYDLKDVHTNDAGHGSPPEYVFCPVCNHRQAVKVPSTWVSTLYPNDF